VLDINGGEFVVLALLAALLLGPDRLPDLARSAARLVRRGRDFATGASAQMKEEMGVDLDQVDWRRYDPRQYHPKRIVQNALSDAFDDGEGGTAAGASGRKPGAAASAAKRAEAARTQPAGGGGAPGSSGAVRPTGSSRSTAATAGPASAARDTARVSAPRTPQRPSPPPTTWADAARRAGVDDDAT
jgi:sec-independent protein translocase protein TatB